VILFGGASMVVGGGNFRSTLPPILCGGYMEWSPAHWRLDKTFSATLMRLNREIRDV
jgi:hypothetical protein